MCGARPRSRPCWGRRTPTSSTAFYDVTRAGNWEVGNILNRTEAGVVSAEDEARLKPLREKLLLAREKRVRPGRDDKVLADWNGTDDRGAGAGRRLPRRG